MASQVKLNARSESGIVWSGWAFYANFFRTFADLLRRASCSRLAVSRRCSWPHGDTRLRGASAWQAAPWLQQSWNRIDLARYYEYKASYAGR